MILARGIQITGRLPLIEALPMVQSTLSSLASAVLTSYRAASASASRLPARSSPRCAPTLSYKVIVDSDGRGLRHHSAKRILDVIGHHEDGLLA